jgi:exodeoxyribonuclease V beta subunit
VDPDALVAGLLPALDTPLGGLVDRRRLRDFTPADRLAELDFELPLAGGDSPRGTAATLADIAGLLRRHLSSSDPLAGYADALHSPALAWQRLRGYLSGSIDAVLRLRTPDGDARYLVVDYKTNWLGTFGPDGAEPLTAWHYRPAALAEEMVRAHYPLQALLYSVALHRFLRWRQPGYNPDGHLGGVLYLFLRGMCGPHTPVADGNPCGVFSWQPPPALVEDVSALLDRGAP